MNDRDLKSWLRNELFERVPTNIAIIDRNFQIVEANQNFTQAFGDWNGKLCYKIFKGLDKPCQSCQAHAIFSDGQRRVCEEQRFNLKGDLAYYIVHFEPIVDDAGNIPYIIEMSQDVTENRLLKREYDILFDRVPCYVTVVNRDMNIVRNNEAFRKTFGESIGKKCYEMYRHFDQPCNNCPAKKTFEDGEIHTANKIGANKHGEQIHYFVTTSPISRGDKNPSHVIEMALDITQIKLLETRLKEAFDFQESMIERSIDGIVAANAKGEIIIFNPSAEKLFQFSASDVLGHKMLERFFPARFLNTATNTESTCVIETAKIVNREGEPIAVRFSGVRLMSEETFIGFAGFFQDLRELKRLESEKLEAERLAAVGQTVAGLAHGIKNVLMALDGGIYVVNSGMKNDDKELMQQGWDILQRNIDRISTYVKDFLNFAKGHSTLHVQSVDPNQITHDVINLYKDHAEQAGIDLSVTFQENLGKYNLDPEGIHTCLANLISNAIDACEMSQQTQGSVMVRVFEHKDTLVFEVRDNGCGMDWEVKKKIFTTFFSTKGTAKGTGLGLLVTRRIAQEHGGKVDVETSEGQGSVFRLEFPKNRLPKLVKDEKM